MANYNYLKSQKQIKSGFRLHECNWGTVYDKSARGGL